jgi:hypothetical protein
MKNLPVGERSREQERIGLLRDRNEGGILRLPVAKDVLVKCPPFVFHPALLEVVRLNPHHYERASGFKRAINSASKIGMVQRFVAKEDVPAARSQKTKYMGRQIVALGTEAQKYIIFFSGSRTRRNRRNLGPRIFQQEVSAYQNIRYRAQGKLGCGGDIIRADVAGKYSPKVHVVHGFLNHHLKTVVRTIPTVPEDPVRVELALSGRHRRMETIYPEQPDGTVEQLAPNDFTVTKDRSWPDGHFCNTVDFDAVVFCIYVDETATNLDWFLVGEANPYAILPG